MDQRQLESDVRQRYESSEVYRRKGKRKGRLRALALSVPELSILIILITCGYVVMAVFSKVQATQVLQENVLP